VLAAALTAAVAVSLAACSSAATGTGGDGHHAASRPSSSTTTRAVSAPKTTSSTLTGKWKGRYGGSYNGTFKLRWHQSGSHLRGHITISNPPSRLPINGTLHGSKISFGTVGSLAITYSGTISGDSMSGTYRVHGGNASTGGPWSASKV